MVIILVKLCILLVGFCAEFVTQLLSVERKAKKVTKKRQQASELKRDHTVAVGQIRAVGIRPIIKDRGWVSIEKDSHSARRAERNRQRQARPW